MKRFMSMIVVACLAAGLMAGAALADAGPKEKKAPSAQQALGAAETLPVAKAECSDATVELLDELYLKGEMVRSKYQALRGQAIDDCRKLRGMGAAAAADPNELKAFWRDGLFLENKNVKLRLGGRIHWQWAYYDVDKKENARAGQASGPLAPIEGFGEAFRRLRTDLRGELYDAMDFRVQLDFAPAFDTGGTVEAKDIYLSFIKVPYLQTIRIGHQHEPFSLEEITSSNDTTFVERSLPVEAFSPSRNVGVVVLGSYLDRRLTTRAGVFQNEDPDGSTAFNDFNDWNAGARVTGLPWYEDKGRRLLHLGLGYQHRFRDDNIAGSQVRFRSRPELRPLGGNTRLADTGSLFTDGVNLFGGEAALVYGPFSIQGEYMLAQVQDARASLTAAKEDLSLSGYYAQASYFLTGESRAYSQSTGIFGAVKPSQNFSISQGGWGAWELAVRWSALDLNDDSVFGGEMRDITAGLNWYLNPNMRIMFNYVNFQIKDGGITAQGASRDATQSGNAFGGRLQVAF